MKRHLAIFSKEGLTRILNGLKTVESRFSKNRIPPFGEISVGDLVYFKTPGKDISGQFFVKKVLSLENIDQKDWEFIRSFYGKQISLGSEELDKQFFRSKEEARFGTLIFIERVEQFLTPPVKITKKDRRGWVVLDND